MSKFHSYLDVRLVNETANSGRGDWMLLAPLIYESDIAGHIEVPFGFHTDFASVPRLPFAFWLCGDAARYPSVVHDFLYRTQIVSKKVADKVFHEASEVVKVPGWKADLMYEGVHLFGTSSWEEDKDALR